MSRSSLAIASETPAARAAWRRTVDGPSRGSSGAGSEMVQCIASFFAPPVRRVRDRSPGSSASFASSRASRRGQGEARRPESVGRGAGGAGRERGGGSPGGGASAGGGSGGGDPRGGAAPRARRRGRRARRPVAAAARGGDRRDATPRRGRGGGRGRGDARPRERRRAPTARASPCRSVEGEAPGALANNTAPTERRTTRREGRHQCGQNRRDRSPACVTDTLGTRRRSRDSPIGGSRRSSRVVSDSHRGSHRPLAFVRDAGCPFPRLVRRAFPRARRTPRSRASGLGR